MNQYKPIRCAVLDDEPIAVRLLAQYVRQFQGLELVLQTTDPDEVLSLVSRNGVDLVFLDIQMPKMTGLDLMSMIGSNTGIILTTAFPDYALAGFDNDVIDYLLKPISFERFSMAVIKAKERIIDHNFAVIPPDFIFIKSGHRLLRINFNDILYIEGLRDYISIHTAKGKVLSLEGLNHMETTLPPGQFTRIHKSYIINKSKVDFLKRWEVCIDNRFFPVGETYRTKVSTEFGL